MRGGFLGRRLAQVIPVLFGVSVVTWGLTSLAPGDAAEVYARQFAENGRPSIEEIARSRQALHLDGNLFEQYAYWVSRVVRGDLGHSFVTGRSVAAELRGRLPATMLLAVAAITFVIVVGVGVGVAAAIWRGRVGDSVVRVVAVGGGAVPSFWLLFMLIWTFSVHWHLLPSFGRGPHLWSTNVILPAVALGLVHLGATARLTRSSMIESFGQEYVRAARARGVRERTVVVSHAFRNALLPVLTQTGLAFAGMLGGAVVVETVYAWPGVGKLATDAIAAKDYPVLQGTVLLSAIIYLTVSTLVDLAYGVADPRISDGYDHAGGHPEMLVGLTIEHSDAP